MGRHGKKLFYGWFVVGALFMANFLGQGGVRNGFGIFVETWENEFVSSTASISMAASIGWLVNGIAQPILGRAADKYGGKLIALVSLGVLAIGGVGIAFANGLLYLIVVYGLIMSFASAGISPATCGVIVVRWFEKRRGTAMSVLAAGGSVGGLVCVPLMAYIMEAVDWRTAWVVLGLLGFLAVPVIWIIVRNHPREIGMKTDGAETIKGTNSAVNDGVLVKKNWKDALKTVPLWQLSAGYFVCGITTSSMGVHYVRWAVSEDISTSNAAWAFGVLSAINAVAVILVGIFSDRLERRKVLGIVYLVRSSAFLALVLIPSTQAIWMFALIGGASWLATVPLTSSLTADIYGVRHLGILFGLATMSHQIGGALATYLFGYAFDYFGNYDIAFTFAAITCVGAGIVSLAIKEKRYSVRYAYSRNL